MKTIESNIIINAKPEKVRSFFLNYQNYPSWNPFLVKFAKYTNKEDPELKVGDELQIDTQKEEFTGILVYVFYLFGLFKKTQESFINLNEVLKDQVENN